MTHQDELMTGNKKWDRTYAPAHLLRAVALAYDSMADDDLWTSAGDEWFAWRSVFVERAVPHVIAHWSRLTEQPAFCFPYTVDCIVNAWIKWRKHGAEVRTRFRSRLGLPYQEEKIKSKTESPDLFAGHANGELHSVEIKDNDDP